MNTKLIKIVMGLMSLLVMTACNGSEKHPSQAHDPQKIADFINANIVPDLSDMAGVELGRYKVEEGAVFDTSKSPCDSDISSDYNCCLLDGWLLRFGYESPSAKGFDFEKSSRFDLTGVHRILKMDTTICIADFEVQNWQMKKTIDLLGSDSESDGVSFKYELAEDKDSYSILSNRSRLEVPKSQKSNE